MQYQIKYNVNPPTKLYEINADEELFFKTFSLKLTESDNRCIILHRMSNGTLEICFDNYPLGKIKLQGRKQSMQILKSLYKYEVIEGNVKDFIERIDDVILYMKKYCK